MQPLTEERLFYLNQNESARKTLDIEARADARDLAMERQAQLEKEYQHSLRVAKDKLVREWQSNYKNVHTPTGRLLLGVEGEPLADNDHLSVRLKRGSSPIEVVVRHSYAADRRTVRGIWGDTDTDSFELKEGMAAQFVDPEPEPEPDEWHVRYFRQKWCVVKGEYNAGAYSEMEEAQRVRDLLLANDRVRPNTGTEPIKYRKV